MNLNFKYCTVLILFLLCRLTAIATSFSVGSTQFYATPNSLYSANVVQDGDTIEIDAETYIGNNSLAVWDKNNLLIKGVGGKAHLIANGAYIWGKGIWVLAGDNITVENIKFEGATVPSNNGAGIRLDGNGLTIRYCDFLDCENGILTNNSGLGTVDIQYSEFNHNGYGGGYTHNLYVGHINKLIFKFNYSHHAIVGHNLKSRAQENYILYNRIMDEQTGNSSRLIDLPNGGFSIIMGNLLMQGNNAPNNNMVGYGLEGLTNTDNQLLLINNTFVNKRTASCLFVAIEPGTSVANVSNNIFTGTGTLISGTTTAMTNNVVAPIITNMNFVDEANYDYHITVNSPAIDSGSIVSPVNGYSLTPDFVYNHPIDSMVRILDGVIDVGAYEYNSPLSIKNNIPLVHTVYPNPFNEKIILKGAILKRTDISISNSLGQDFTNLITIKINGDITQINTSNLPSGMYIIKAKTIANKVYKQ